METGGWGGLHYYAHALCNALEKQAVDLTMLTSETYELEDRPHPFRRIHFFRREHYLRTIRKLTALLVAQRPHLIHIQSLIAPRKDIILLLLFRALKVRVVMTVHNILPHEVRPLEKAVYGLYYRLADALILHSEANRRELLEWLPKLRPRTHVIPHGNYEDFRDLEMGREAARQHLKLPAERQIVLFFGAIRPYKGLDLLLEAVGGVRENCPESLFVVAGIVSPELQQGYEAQIEKLGIGGESLVTRFDYLSTEEAIAYVCAADLVVLPYRKIYQSGVLFWAYSFGRAVVGTRVGSFTETIEHGKSGWLIEKEDVGALGLALVEALRDPQRLEEAGAYARELAASRYDWNDIAAQTVSVYEEIGKRD